MATWQSITLEIPGKNVLQPIVNMMETLMVYLEVLKAILETIKKFLVAIGNPIKALVESIMALIQEVIQALNQVGLYGYFDIPNPDVDPNFSRCSGGSSTFLKRFSWSLYSTTEPNRPQPVASLNQSGFVMLMVSADGIVEVIRLINAILMFFGKDHIQARYAAPANVRCLPLGPKGDPIFAIASIFNTQLTGVAIEWSLATSQTAHTVGFDDMFPNAAQEFVPQTWLIEKSAIPVTKEITVDDMTSLSDSAGKVMVMRETPFQKTGVLMSRKEPLRDDHREAVIKFQQYFVVDASSPTFWTGQLGTFRWVDTEVKPDTIYYYRVRAFSGNLAIDNENWMVFNGPVFTPNNPMTFVWPSTDGNPISMGNPSGIMQIRLPKIPTNFDMVNNLERLFQTAFSLNFHLPPIVEHDNAKPPNITRPVFVTTPNPASPKTIGMPATPKTLVTDIGLGSLQSQAGTLATFNSGPLASLVQDLTSLTTAYTPDSVTGQLPQMPWQTLGVRYQAARLADLTAKHMLSNGSACIASVQTAMQSYPTYGLSDVGVLKGKTNISQMVFALTDIGDGSGIDTYTNAITRQQAATYGQIFNDANFRLNILKVVNYIVQVALGGGGGAWVSVCFLRDIVPWSGQILYRIVAYIQALLDAFNGVMQQVADFINLIERKIAALERFIEFLIKVMEYILSLKISCYALSSGTMTGGVDQWLETIANAGGNKPPDNPGGYSAGVVLAYVAPNVSLIESAFNLIF